MPAFNFSFPNNLPRISLPRGESFAVVLLLLFSVIFNLYFLSPEVTINVAPLNDEVLHLTNLERTIYTIALGQNTTDNWQPNIGLGYPLFHYYQHLPYVIPAAFEFVALVFWHVAPAPIDLWHWATYLLLALFPLSIYWSMRRFEFARLPAVFAALVSSLLSTNGLYGFDFNSYVWSGYGLETQLWGMFFLPPMLAQGYVALKSGRGYFLAVLLLAILLLSHLMLGYIALVSLVLIALVIAFGQREKPLASGSAYRWLIVKRLALVLVLTALVTAYFFVPFVADGAYLNRSVWENPGKYDSYGWQWVLNALVTGQLFDANRLPLLTVLAAVGFVFCLRQWPREEHYRVPIVLSVAWLLLYFGRPTWGAWLNLLPLSGDLQLHRFIAGIHLSAIFLMGIGLAALWQWARTRWRALALSVLTVGMLLPIYSERVGYYMQNTAWKIQTQQVFVGEERDLSSLLTTLRSLPPGRVYAGLGNNWGKEYRIGFVPMYAWLQLQGLDMTGYLYHALSLNGDLQVLFNEKRAEQYDLFNIRYVVAPSNLTLPDFVKPLQTFGRHRLYVVETTGYFDLVDSSLTFAGDKRSWYPAAFAWLQSNLLRNKDYPTVKLGRAVDNVLPLSQASVLLPKSSLRTPLSFGRILSEKIDSNIFQVEVEVTRASTLLLKTTYHPNWHAYVDGVEPPTRMLMPSYIGIPLVPGKHHVWLQYQPQAYRSYLQWLGLFTLFLLFVAERKRTFITAIVARLARARRFIPTIPLSKVQRWCLGIYLFFLAVYLMSAPGHFWSTDHVGVYLTTQSLVERQSLVIKPMNNSIVGSDGKTYYTSMLGQSLVSMPLYLMGKFVDTVGTPDVKAYFAGTNMGDWGGTVPIFFVSLLNQFVAPLICVMVFLFGLRLDVTPRAAFLTTLLFGFGTNVWVGAREYFQHPLETLCLLLAVYVLFAHRDALQRKHAFWSGLALACGILVRVNLVFAVPIVGLYLLILAYKQAQSIRVVLSVFAMPICLLLIFIFYFNYARFGNLFAFHPAAERVGFALSSIPLGIYGNLLSPGRSVFLYSLPTLLGVYFFRRFYRAQRLAAILFAALGVAFLVFYSSFISWEGGWSFGPRYLQLMIPFLIIPTVYAWEHRRTAFVAWLLGVLGVGVQILGVAVNISYVYWDWVRMNLNPAEAFIFFPDISAIPMHLHDLMAGQYIDLWLVWVYQQFGAGVFLLTFAVPASILIFSLSLLSRNRVVQSQIES